MAASIRDHYLAWRYLRAINEELPVFVIRKRKIKQAGLAITEAMQYQRAKDRIRLIVRHG